MVFCRKSNRSRRSVVEVLAVFAQALTRKRRLRVLLVIDLALPAFVGPGGGAEADQGGQAHSGWALYSEVGPTTKCTFVGALQRIETDPIGIERYSFSQCAIQNLS